MQRKDNVGQGGGPLACVLGRLGQPRLRPVSPADISLCKPRDPLYCLSQINSACLLFVIK